MTPTRAAQTGSWLRWWLAAGGTVTVIATLVAVGATSVAATTSPAQTAVNLGTSSPFAVLAATAITNTGATVITGDIGLSPDGATSVTGFPPGVVNGAEYAADGVALQAQNDLTTAYDSAQSAPSTNNVTGVDLGNLTLTAGVYTASSSMTLNGPLTLTGNASSVFVFQAGSTLTTGSTGPASVLLTGGVQACNVFWQVGSSATLGTLTTDFVGTIMALTSATLDTGASVTGRVLARNGEVTLDDNTISVPSCASTTTTTTTVPATTTTTTTTVPTTTTTVPTTTTTVPATTTTTTTVPTTTTTTTTTVTVTATVPSPTSISTLVSKRSITLGGAVSDAASVLVHGTDVLPSGLVRFFECGPGASSCTPSLGTPLHPEEHLVGGAATSASFTPKTTGTYCFAASYVPGSSLFRASTESGTAANGECVTVTAASATAIPSAPTGKPWASWLYWLLVAAGGAVGLSLLATGAYRRRMFAQERARGRPGTS
ncbi:MAG: ice-binding family protein [Actinomycetota bacterium]|nr:ice-binding family protein [Actinomycetota bacterium]